MCTENETNTGYGLSSNFMHLKSTKRRHLISLISIPDNNHKT